MDNKTINHQGSAGDQPSSGQNDALSAKVGFQAEITLAGQWTGAPFHLESC